MKKLFTRFLIALAAILFSASSDAAWDDRFFPTHDKPPRVGSGTNLTFQLDVVSSQMVWAVSERYWALNKTTGWLYLEPGSNERIDAIQWYTNQPPRNYENILLAVKTGVRFIVEDFLDINAMTNGPNELIYHTTTGLLAQLSLPQDYFDVVPIRNPMGHDWPTNNPARQSGKDYGWHGLYMILTNLTHTLEGGFLNERFEDRYDFIGGPLTCSILTESNFPRNISSYGGGASASDYFSFGRYDANPNLPLERYTLKSSFGVFGKKAAWLYNKELAGVDFAYLDATAERWVQQVRFNLNLSGFADIFDSIRGQIEAACPNVFYEELVWTFEGMTSNTTILDDGNFLKTTATSLFAIPCSAETLIEFAEDADVQEADSRVSSDCAFTEYPGADTKFSEVKSEQNYAHILEWNFRYK